MTQALAERAVEVTSNVSYLLEGAEETPLLLDNISQLEQYGFLPAFRIPAILTVSVPRILRDIYVFAKSETQRNLLLRILFAKTLRVRYFSLDMQLRGLTKQFKVLHQCTIRSVPSLIVLQEKTVKKPLVLCTGSPSTTTQEDGALSEIVPPNNNSSAVNARYSDIFGIYSVPLMLHSGSIFHNANKFAVFGGTYYAAQSLVVKQVQGENLL